MYNCLISLPIHHQVPVEMSISTFNCIVGTNYEFNLAKKQVFSSNVRKKIVNRKRWDIPSLANINARSLNVEKSDELQAIVDNNNVDLICVAEIWLIIIIIMIMFQTPVVH